MSMTCDHSALHSGGARFMPTRSASGGHSCVYCIRGRNCKRLRLFHGEDVGFHIECSPFEGDDQIDV